MLLVEVLNEHVQGTFTLLGKYGRVEGGFLSVDHCKKTKGIGGKLLKPIPSSVNLLMNTQDNTIDNI